MKRSILAAAALGVALVAGGVILAIGSSSDDAAPSVLSAASLKENGITSRAEWFSSNPRTTPAQIAMACELPATAARRFDRELGQTFAVDTLARLEAVCKG
jgi:hypothetical protein